MISLSYLFISNLSYFFNISLFYHLLLLFIIIYYYYLLLFIIIYYCYYYFCDFYRYFYRHFVEMSHLRSIFGPFECVFSANQSQHCAKLAIRTVKTIKKWHPNVYECISLRRIVIKVRYGFGIRKYFSAKTFFPPKRCLVSDYTFYDGAHSHTRTKEVSSGG